MADDSGESVSVPTSSSLDMPIGLVPAAIPMAGAVGLECGSAIKPATLTAQFAQSKREKISRKRNRILRGSCTCSLVASFKKFEEKRAMTMTSITLSAQRSCKELSNALMYSAVKIINTFVSEMRYLSSKGRSQWVVINRISVSFT